jgi:hypothetical protein
MYPLYLGMQINKCARMHTHTYMPIHLAFVIYKRHWLTMNYDTFGVSPFSHPAHDTTLNTTKLDFAFRSLSPPAEQHCKAFITTSCSKKKSSEWRWHWRVTEVLLGAGNGMNVMVQLLSRLTAFNASNGLRRNRKNLTSKCKPFSCHLRLYGSQHCTTGLVALYTDRVQDVNARTLPP